MCKKLLLFTLGITLFFGASQSLWAQCNPLAGGTYTVGSSTADFSTLEQALAQIACGNVSGPVILQLQTGIWRSHHQLPATHHLVRIQGNASVVFEADPLALSPSIFSVVTGGRWELNGLQLLRTQLGVNGGPLISVVMADTFRLLDSRLEDLSADARATNLAIAIEATAGTFTLGHNHISGFYGGVQIVHADSAFHLVFAHNHVSNYRNFALQLAGAHDAQLHHNYFGSVRHADSMACVIGLERLYRLDFYNNQIQGSLPGKLLHLRAALADGMAGFNRVYNNVFEGQVDGRSWPLSQAIRLIHLQTDSAAGATALLFAHNSLGVQLQNQSADSLQAILFMSGSRHPGDSLACFNNIFEAAPMAGGSFPANFRALVRPWNLAGYTDHNAFWLGGGGGTSYFRLYGPPLQDFATLAAWRSATQRDLNSVLASAAFLGPRRMQPSATAIDNKGISLPGLQLDFSGAIRGLIPDVGAYEFEPPARELALVGLNLPASGCNPSPVFPQLLIRNLGLDSLPAPRLRLLLNGQLLAVEQFSGQLAPASEQWISFSTQLNFTAPGDYWVEIYPDSQYDGRPENDSLFGSVRNTLLNQFPQVRDFEMADQQLTAGGAGFGLRRQAATAISGGRGPLRDASEDATGHYLLADARYAQAGDSAVYQWECLAFDPLELYALRYRLHSRGQMQMWVQARWGGGWHTIDSITQPQSQAADARWQMRNLLLNTQTDALRWILVATADSLAYIALDALELDGYSIENLVLDSVQFQYDPCDAQQPVQATLFVRNTGLAILNQIRVGGQINSHAVQYRDVNRLLFPGDVDTVQLSLAAQNSATGQLSFFTANLGDTYRGYDTIRLPHVRVAQVTAYPYLANFETAQGWQTGGFNSSWERAKPTGPLMNAAADGEWCWITNPSGLPNRGERSWLESPCFDFSGLGIPVMRFAIRHQLSSRMLAQMQFNRGQGWELLGDLFAFGSQGWYDAPAPLHASVNGPAWTGEGRTSWSQAVFLMPELTAASSIRFRIMFYHDFDTSSAPLALEGIAIDQFSISDLGGSRALLGDTSLAPTASADQISCVANAPLAITSLVSNPSQVQSVSLRWHNSQGQEQSVPMSLISSGSGLGLYQASLPAAVQPEQLSVRVFVQSDSLRIGPARFISRQPLQTQLADISGPERLPITLDAGLAASTSLSPATSFNDSASGVWLSLEANRFTEVWALRLNVTEFTGVQVYWQSEYPGITSPSALHSSPVASGALVMLQPGLGQLSFQRPLLLVPGQRAYLYIKTSKPGTFILAQRNPSSSVFQHAVLNLEAGQMLSDFGATPTGQAWPAAEIFVRNPADAVRWYGVNGQLIGTQPILPSLIMGSGSIRLELDKGNCSFTDSLVITSTGTFDAGLTRIIQPILSEVVPGVFYAVEVAVQNFGSLALDTFVLAYRVNGAELAIATVNRSLAPGDTLHFTFPQSWTWVEPGSLEFCAYPKYITLDVNPANDIRCEYRFPTGVASLQRGEALVYPNPANTHVRIQTEEVWGKEAVWELYDLSGRLVMRQALEAGQRQTDVQLQSLQAGLYSYRIVDALHYWHGRVVIIP
ncbi:MAG: T9SS type A sorting domain-containing protein [Bacteroidia bacterium]